MSDSKVTKKVLFLAIREQKSKRQLAAELGVTVKVIDGALERFHIRWRSKATPTAARDLIEAERVIEMAVRNENRLPWEAHPQPLTDVVVRGQ